MTGIVLGIETSCDETAAAVVAFDRTIRSSVVLSQLEDHRAYGGVVPEIAARAHVEHLDGLIEQAMAKAGTSFAELSGVAATAGPGLIGGVLVGLVTGKAIAAAAGAPFVAVNHLEGHALSARLSHGVGFPYLLLLVTGGHCQLLSCEGLGRYERLGTTIDDAIGEAFDKSARMLGMGYPGGPEIERAAAHGNPKRFALPRPMLGREGCDFSFSGLKTAIRRLAEDKTLATQDVADVAASFQAAVGDVVADRARNAMTWFAERHRGTRTLVVAGGVAANAALRTRLEAVAHKCGFAVVAPPKELCTDNAAMIAWAGVERLRAGLTDALDAPGRARWPLSELTDKRTAQGIAS
ncbi:MAG: tRNA (adenosine(37)-N6)-threonylcarbamoyltransferase complex transferase subunit TsaD [Alphaproteobacteria bacterium]|nr:tRNA (adenosine(37)-N6)-threonylcarbamoyltransferase complex transferase subunit TsaD [Alphaproteobacteria bacterium]